MSASGEPRVLVVGAGGLGCAAADGLWRAGVHALTVLDDDRVDATNLHRQLSYKSADVGDLKVDALARALPGITPRALRFTADNAAAQLAGHAVVIDATDGALSKFTIADAARAARLPLVHGAALGWIGQITTIIPAGPCLRCLWDGPPSMEAATCEAAGVMGPLPGLIGALQAVAALKLLQAPPGAQAGAGRLLSYDARLLRFRTIRYDRRCPACTASEEPDVAS